MAVASARLYASLHLAPDNYASTPSLSFFTDRMPFLPPNQQHQSTEGRSEIEIGQEKQEREDTAHLNPCLSSPDLLYAELLSMLIMLNMFIT